MEFLSFLATLIRLKQGNFLHFSQEHFALFSLFLQSFFQDSQMATGGGSASSSQSSTLSSEQLQLVVAAVKKGMKEELSSLKRELVGEREQSGNCLLKKLRLEKLLAF